MEAVATEQDLLRSLASDYEGAPPSATPWAAECRRRGYRRFLELGVPTARMEAWRFTNPSVIARTPFRAAAAVSATTARPLLPDPLAKARLVFVNGVFSPELSTGKAPAGVTVTGLAQALAEDPEPLRPFLETDDTGEAFESLNAGFLHDGAVVRIAPGAVATEPVEVLYLSVPGEGPSATHPRTLVVAGTHSQASLVETYAGGKGDATLTNSVTTISCGEGAVLEHSKLQDESESAFHVHAIRVAQERASNFVSHNLALGSALARTDLSVRFAGEGGECTLNGLFIGTGSQHLDTHTVIDHAQPRCVSRELYKGILDGRARGVFDGKIIVRPGAQKTDAIQTNKNLLLSKEALVDSTPALEIFADDVKCKHGSTIGQLDAAALFYLRSRGIGEPEARALLTYAFAADLAQRLKVPALRARLESRLASRLPAAGETR
jgi:Fe-S cluster assembly protein SufD